jgi:hypothetical protein
MNRNSIEHELRVGGRGNNSSRVALVVRPASPSLSRNFASTAESDENCSVGTQTDGSDIFELLNSAVLEVLAPDVELAARVIGHLYRLPAGLRSLIYGFVTHGDNDGRSSNTSSPNAKDGTDSQQTSSIVPSLISPNKKRQANQDGDGDPEDQKPRDKRNRDRSYHKATLRTPKYACLFNIKDPRKYCVVNEVGGTGDFYRSCMGAGWTELRGLLYVSPIPCDPYNDHRT